MRERASCLWFVVGGWLALLETSRAFSFSYTAPTSCNPLNVTWQGGNAPFYMFITPPSGTPRNISIPDEAYDGTSGAFSTTLELAAGRNFILTMSDVTGFGTGGNSDILTVGGGSSGCNITDPSSGFSFKLASGIQQCGVYSISDYGGATQPVHAEGLIPVGSAFTVNIPDGDTSYNWTVNMASGTRFLMFMQDAEGRLSTVTDTQQVGGSNNSSCLDSNSPASTLSSVTQEPTANPTATANPTPSGSHGGNNNKAAIIGGSIAGGIVFLVLVVLLVWWLARRRQDPMDKYAKKRRKKGMDGLGTLDLASSTPNLPATSPNQLPPFEFEPQPFILPHPANNRVENVPLSPTTHYGSSNDRTATQVHTPRSPSDSTRPSSSNKAAMAGAEGLQPQRRFVLHTDAGSVANLSTVELPPTYNAAAGGGEPTAGAAIPSPSPSPPPPEHNLAPPAAPEPGLLQGNTPSEGPTPPSQNHSTGEQSSDAHLQ